MQLFIHSYVRLLQGISMSNISISFTAQVTRVTAARGKDPRLQDQVKRCGHTGMKETVGEGAEDRGGILD